jgi:hypothetical protein
VIPLQVGRLTPADKTNPKAIGAKFAHNIFLAHEDGTPAEWVKDGALHGVDEEMLASLLGEVCAIGMECGVSVLRDRLVAVAKASPKGAGLEATVDVDGRPNLGAMVRALHAEIRWIAQLHANDTTGQAASDQRALARLAEKIRAVALRLGYGCDEVNGASEPGCEPPEWSPPVESPLQGIRNPERACRSYFFPLPGMKPCEKCGGSARVELDVSDSGTGYSVGTGYLHSGNCPTLSCPHGIRWRDACAECEAKHAAECEEEP